jgi:Putative Ig domain
MNMKTKNNPAIALALFSLAALLFLVACPTTDEPIRVLNMQIDKDNDSLMAFDSLIVKVYNKDSSYTQIVFHGKLTDPKQVLGMPLDPRISKEYKVSIVGYKGGKVGVNKEIAILGANNFTSKDLPVQTGKDTVIIVIEPAIPEILAPSDTSVAEGDSLRFRVSVRNPLSGATTLTLKDTLPGAALDTVGRDPGDSYFTWRPNYNQGRIEPYAVTFVYASAGRRVEKIARVKVLNVNRPPKLVTIADQKVKENETLTFKVEATDPDQDSLTLTNTVLPGGAAFSSGSFSWKPTVGQAGNYSVKFKAFDGKDSDLVAVLITVGNVDVPPTLNVKITSPARDTLINFTPITILYTVNGTIRQKKFDLKDGKNKIFIDTTVAGRTALDTLTITLDTTPPGMPTVNGPSPVHTRTPSWSWASGGNGNGIYRYRLDIDDLASATSTTDTAYTSSKDLDPGSHTLFVQERDAAGNWSHSGKRAVRIDTTRPAPPEVIVNPALPTANTRPTWNWMGSGDDRSGLFRYRLDNSDLSTGATETKETGYQPDSKSPLADGAHILYVQQQDSAGNWSLAGSAKATVDATPPLAPKLVVTPTSPTNNRKPAWSWSTPGSGGIGVFRYRLDASDFAAVAETKTDTYSPDSNLSEGIHTLYVQERDSAGNWSQTSSLAVRIDVTAPAAPAVSMSPVSPTANPKPKWTWSSGGHGGMGTYRYRLDNTDEAGAITLRDTSYTPATGLTDGVHVFYVQERDSAGNWSAVTLSSVEIVLGQTVGAQGFTAGAAKFISLAISRLGVPYVAFSDSSQGFKTTVMTFNGVSWSTVGTAGFSTGVANEVKLNIDPDGVPYVAYIDVATGNKAMVMKLNGSKWDPVGIPGASAAAVKYLGFVMDAQGVPYLGYWDEGYGTEDGYLNGGASVVSFNGIKWSYVGRAGFSKSRAYYMSLAITGAGIPYVAYEDGANTAASVRRFADTGWAMIGGDVTVGRGDPNSLAVNSQGKPYLAYREDIDLSNGFGKARTYDGAKWVDFGGAYFSPDRARVFSLAISNRDVPFIAFQNTLEQNKAVLVKLEGGSWTKVGGDLSVSGADFISLAFSGTGVPYVAFSDANRGNKITVVKSLP